MLIASFCSRLERCYHPHFIDELIGDHTNKISHSFFNNYRSSFWLPILECYLKHEKISSLLYLLLLHRKKCD